MTLRVKSRSDIFSPNISPARKPVIPRTANIVEYGSFAAAIIFPTCSASKNLASLVWEQRLSPGDRDRTPCTSPGKIAPAPLQRSPASATPGPGWTCLRARSLRKTNPAGEPPLQVLWFACGDHAIPRALSMLPRALESSWQCSGVELPASPAGDLPRHPGFEHRRMARCLSRRPRKRLGQEPTLARPGLRVLKHLTPRLFAPDR